MLVFCKIDGRVLGGMQFGWLLRLRGAVWGAVGGVIGCRGGGGVLLAALFMGCC